LVRPVQFNCTHCF